MNSIIIEDEILSAHRLKNILGDIDPSIIVEEVLDSIEASAKWLKKHQHPSIIFMDIQLSDGLCFEIFKQVEVQSPVIFITAYDEYALEAFKVNSIDYLLKPISKEDLQRSLHKLDELKHQQSEELNNKMEKLLRSLEETTRSYKSRFLIKSGQTLLTIFDKDIAYFISDRKLTLLVTRDGIKRPMDETLEELESQINPRQFFRVNRQFIVGIDSIASVHKYFNGKLKLHLKPPTDHEVTISRERARVFKNWLNK
jgi:two-component system response regulator LytT